MAVAARTLQQAPSRRLGGSPPGARPAPGTRPAARRPAPFLLVVVALVTVLGVGLVSAQALVAQGSFRLQELRQEAERLEREFGRLRLRADRLSTPERIERAGRKAGLVYPPGGFQPLRLPPGHAPADGGGGAPGVAGAAEIKAALGAGG